MFLKSLKIQNGDETIRNILFKKGLNLIVDETKTKDKKESGNNVGKTTVIRLIDFCLGGNGESIYKDTEFKDKNSNTKIENFLKESNIIISIVLKENLEIEESQEITIRKNFLKRNLKIQEINDKNYTNNDEFFTNLKKLVFNSSQEKPTFKQIVSKNIRDEKNKLINTLKVLHPTTTMGEYEALYLFWLGINTDTADRKLQIHYQLKIEQNLQTRLRKENNLSSIEQSLIVVNRDIEELNKQKLHLDINKNYEIDISTLNQTKLNINKLSTELGRLLIRKDLINESKMDLETEFSDADSESIRNLYDEAKSLIPAIQKTFEETLLFHNKMVAQKIKYISYELPALEESINKIHENIRIERELEETLTSKLVTSVTAKDLELLISELNKAYERKGNLEEQKRLWDSTNSKTETLSTELENIDKGISSQDDLIKSRIIEFNKYFSEISSQLYGEKFILSSNITEKGYELNIGTVSGNPGTGKKKGQIAAFDIAYIKFADALNIPCLHFIMHDQIENIHDNQISNLLLDIVSKVNCQYIVPVLSDKLPKDIDVNKYKVLTLSQTNKLLKQP